MTAFEYVTMRCRELHERPVDVRGPSRIKRLVNVRAIIAAELKAQGMSLSEIGQQLGARHHTTVLSLLRRPPQKAREIVPDPERQVI